MSDTPRQNWSNDAEFLRVILDSIQDGVYFVDPERRITYWNSGAEALTGYLRHEVLGRCCPERILRHCTPEGVGLCDEGCPLQATLADGKPREEFLLLRHKDGHRVPVRLRVTAVRGLEETIIGAAQVFEEHDFANSSARRAQTLESLHLVDPLTGLANREMIAAKLAERHGEWLRYGIPFGILLIDIDHLKQINLNFGRDAGDRILQMTARTLVKSLRAENLLGRWKTDQFLAIIDNCDAAVLAETGARLRAMVARSSIEWWGEPVRVTVSIAGAIARPEEEEAALLGRAQAVLDSVRNAGGNAVQVE